MSLFYCTGITTTIIIEITIIATCCQWREKGKASFYSLFGFSYSSKLWAFCQSLCLVVQNPIYNEERKILKNIKNVIFYQLQQVFWYMCKSILFFKICTALWSQRKIRIGLFHSKQDFQSVFRHSCYHPVLNNLKFFHFRPFKFHFRPCTLIHSGGKNNLQRVGFKTGKMVVTVVQSKPGGIVLCG